MSLFFTSDEHYGHAAVIRLCSRPFADLAVMHEALIARHNAVVGPDDTVIHLGDFALDERRVKEILARLNGRHELVVGNHDRGHPCHTRAARSRRRYREDYGFSVVHESTTVRLELEGLGRALLSHMPFRNHAHDERYPEYRVTEEQFAGCDVLIHGHVHEKWKRRDTEAGRMLNVGVDVWGFAPVSLEQMREELQKGSA